MEEYLVTLKNPDGDLFHYVVNAPDKFSALDIAGDMFTGSVAIEAKFIQEFQ